MTQPSLRLELAGVLALTLAAALPRLVALDRLPPGLHGDEAWTGIEALRILRDGPIGVWSPSALGQPAGPFYWTALVFLFLEPGVASVRAAMALLGVLTVPAAYLFYRSLFGPRVAFLGAALLAAGFWHIAYSRAAFPPVALPLVESIAFAALFAAFHRDRPLAFALAGGFLGLGFYAYIPYPFVASGVGLFLLVWAVGEMRRHRAPGPVALRLGALGAGGLAVSGPILWHLWQNPGPYLGYGRLTLLPLGREGLGDVAGQFALRAVQVFTHLFRGRPIDFTDGLGAQPLLDPITGLLFLAGLATALWRWRDRRHRFVLLVLAFGLLPAVISASNWGENRRLIGALPVAYLLAGLGLDRALVAGAGFFARLRSARGLRDPAVQRRGPWPAVAAGAGVLLLIVAGLNLRAYFVDFARAEQTRWVYAEELAAACAAVGVRHQPVRVYFYAARWSSRYETCRFLAPGLEAEDRSREFGTFSLEKTVPGPVLYVLLPPYVDQADTLEARYPGGRRTEGRAGDGRLLYVVYGVG